MKEGRPRSRAALVVLAFGATLVLVTLCALGVWQVRRLAWKEDLIAQVDSRVHAVPTPAPPRAAWPTVTAADAYRHVSVTGTFENAAETAVQAVTALGPGFWILTPLRTAAGTVLVNRGFVPAERREPATRPDGQVIAPVTVTGLLRVSEPKGGFLRTNDPGGNHWYSRDVPAIAEARGLSDVAPFFIDADRDASAPPDAPVGGLTVISFPNNHLAYALTWFGMAALLAGAMIWVGRDEWRRRFASTPPRSAVHSR